MKSIFIFLLLSLSFLNASAQLSNVVQDASVYEDKVNDLVYICGLTAELKPCITKLDANFNFIKEYIGDVVVEEKQNCFFNMDKTIKLIEISNPRKSDPVLIYINSEMLEFTPIYVGKKPMYYSSFYQKGDSDYIISASGPVSDSDEETELLDSKLSITRVQLKGDSVRTISTYRMLTKGMLKAKILYVSEEKICFFGKSVNNAIDLYEYNIKEDAIAKTKSIINPSDAEKTSYNVTYDSYRDEFYVSFVENLKINRDHTSKTRVYRLNNKFEIFTEVIEMFHTYTFEDCKFYKKNGYWHYGSKTDNIPVIQVTKDLVNITVYHSQNFDFTTVNGDFVTGIAILGLTDIIIADGSVTTHFYNKQHLLDQRHGDYKGKKRLQDELVGEGQLYRSKFYKNNIPYYILDKKIIKQGRVWPGTEVIYVDLDDYRYYLEASTFKTIDDDSHDDKLTYQVNGSKFVQSKDQSKLLMLQLVKFKAVQYKSNGKRTFKLAIKEL